MIIDSHQHFWKYDAEKHAWIDDEMATIRRDFLPEDLLKVFKENDVDGCIAVQADQTDEETEFLIGLADQNPFINGIVGWVDLRSQDLGQKLEEHSDIPVIKGWRHVVQIEPDPNFLLRSEFLRGIGLLSKYDYTYDILVFPHQLGSVLEFVKKFPNQRFVIDHIAKPYIKDGFFDGWAVMMKKIAECDNVYCKMSGMVTEADYAKWTPEQLKPYMDLVLEAFGTSRVMFGSDWPVCLVAANYGEIKQTVEDAIKELNLSEQRKIMGMNAKTFYKL